MSGAAPGPAPVGTLCIVLHTHLPWVAHHGVWPVGEEWLYQAWTGAYLPLVRVLDGLAAEGRRDLLTLGVTPVLAEQLDDPYCLLGLRHWVGDWRLRAEDAAAGADPVLAAAGTRECVLAGRTLTEVEGRWRHGASPLLRRLADAGAVELLGGPATHPYTPLLHPRFADVQLAAGLADHARRFGSRPGGIWAPECGYAPGLATAYARAGVGHVVVDGPTLAAARPGDPAALARAWDVEGTGVVAFARDVELTYRVWSHHAGYPGGAPYRDFHAMTAGSGMRWAAVTDPATPAHGKQPYDPAAARTATIRDAAGFLTDARARLVELAARRDGRPATVVVAFDTELFGHWWHEGPAWLAAVLRQAPQAGIRLATLAGALAAQDPPARVDLAAGSWGRGKDDRVWAGPEARTVAERAVHAQRAALDVLDALTDPRCPGAGRQRQPVADQVLREALVATASDWAFMMTVGGAARYAADRANAHADAAVRLAGLLGAGDPSAGDEAAVHRSRTGLLAHLDARTLQR